MTGEREGPDGALSTGGANLGTYATRISARLASWTHARASERIWRKDPSFWPQAPASDVASRLGWMSLPETMGPEVEGLRQFAKDVVADGFEHVLLLGMGGSSLAPEVYARTFGSASGYPDLRVLDSTHPEAVVSLVRPETIARTLFIVSSKSGTTLEPNAFFRYAWAKVNASNNNPGRQFVAITDPGTPLQALAQSRGFRRCYTATPDVGGRYSALTHFGLVPCATLGHDPGALLAAAHTMSRACGSSVRAEASPGLALGAALGELALAGHDKVVFLTSPGVGAFPAWVEQLIAESLGKLGRGIVPVPSEARATDTMGAHDAVYVRLRLRAELDPSVEGALDQLAGRGAPVLRFEVDRPDDLGGEIFRWELAIASAGTVIGVDPFDQPDVELAKELAREAMQPATPGAKAGPGLPAPVPAGSDQLPGALGSWLASSRPGDYVAVQAFLAPLEGARRGVEELAEAIRLRSRLATTMGFGPRFLHSTGQLHKGGPPSGLFLQLVDDVSADVPVPELSITFRRILRAQADGDAQALLQKHRRLLRVNVGADPVEGLLAVTRAFRS